MPSRHDAHVIRYRDIRCERVLELLPEDMALGLDEDTWFPPNTTVTGQWFMPTDAGSPIVAIDRAGRLRELKFNPQSGEYEAALATFAALPPVVDNPPEQINCRCSIDPSTLGKLLVEPA